jgi:hypothetical protein
VLATELTSVRSARQDLQVDSQSIPGVDAVAPAGGALLAAMETVGTFNVTRLRRFNGLRAVADLVVDDDLVELAGLDRQPALDEPHVGGGDVPLGRRGVSGLLGLPQY